MVYHYSRLNNPGNIGYSPWTAAHGGTASSAIDVDHAIASFPDLGTGFAVMAALAANKYNQGMITLNQIIAGQNGWTPGNKIAANNIAGYMGISPDDDLNLNDPQAMASFQRALTRQETGSYDQWNSYVAADPSRTPAQRATAAFAANPRIAANPPRSPMPLSLSRGDTDRSTGGAVSQMQRALKAQGYNLGQFGRGRDGVDGRLGRVTTAAIKKYQTDNGLTPTGVAGSATLRSIMAPPQSAITSITPQGTLGG